MLGDRSLSGNEGNELYRNDGDRYTRVGYITGAMSRLDARGFVPADFDRDGDVDMFVFNNAQPCVYLQNDIGASRSWCTVQCVGTKDNRFGVGAQVRLTRGETTQMREIHVGSGYLSSPPPEAHFGLGEEAKIDRIEVRWPNGEVQVVKGVEPNKLVVIEQGAGFRYLIPGQPAKAQPQ